MIKKRLAANYKELDAVKGIMQGYFSEFDSRDSDGDIIIAGAYKKTIKEMGPSGADRIRHLLNHNSNQPVGMVTELVEDGKGLFYTSQLLVGDNKYADYVMHLASKGYKFEHSIGFEVVKNDRRPNANYLQELRLWEGSILTGWGANANTPVTGLKSLGESPIDAILEYKAILHKALTSGSIHDDAFQIIQNQYDEIGTLLKQRQATEPEPSTQPEPAQALTDNHLAAFRKGLFATV